MVPSVNRWNLTPIRIFTPAMIAVCGLITVASATFASPTAPVMRVIIDNSGWTYHGETMLSVMRIVQCLHPGRDHHFFVDRNLVQRLGPVIVDSAFAGRMPTWEVSAI